MPAPQEKPKPSPFLETLAETRKAYPHERVQHEKFGVGLRFQFVDTTCTVYNPKGKSPRVEVRSPSLSVNTIDLAAIVPVVAEQGEQAGVLITSAIDTIFIRETGEYTVTHTMPGSPAPFSDRQPEQKVPASQPQAGEPTPTNDEAVKGTERQRVKVSGFFGKVLDGFPRETEGEERRMIYKLLIGNKAEVQDQEGKEKIDWITVTALEPHVVKFLSEHLETFEKRKTRLRVEGYYQEVEKQLRRSVKKTQEFYAVSIQQEPQE